MIPTRDRAGIAGPLRTLFGLGALGGWTDAQLLDRYLDSHAEQAEAAFSVLVERHGRMVSRICRAVLEDEHDAQDAFQATFLVLARRAGTIQRADSVAPWLFGVARRVAQQAKARTARRREAERQRADLDAARKDTSAADPARTLDAWAELHEEIARLPERYRAPIVLCHLEGMAHEQAARLLGCPVPTLRTRLTRARKRLRDRLSRRGLAPSLGLLAFESVSWASIGPAQLPATVGTTARLALAVRSVSLTISTPAAVSATAAALARSTLWSLTMTSPIRIAAVGIVALLTTGAGFGLLANPEATAARFDDEPNPPASQQPENPEQASEQVRLASIRSEVSGETVILSVLPDGARVENGQLVAELDDAALRDRLANQQIATKLARAELVEALEALENREAEARKYLEVIYPQELKSLEGKIQLLEAEVSRARDRLERASDMLLRGGGYRSANYQIADRFDLQKAEFNLQQAQQQREVLQRYTMPKQIKALGAEVEKARVEMIARKSALRALEDEDARLRESIQQCRIHVEHDGILHHARPGESSEIQVGAKVREGQLLFHIDAEEAEAGDS